MANLKIISGPNKSELMLALFEPCRSNRVMFEFENAGPVRNRWLADINSATRLDGEGFEWTLLCGITYDWIPNTGTYKIKIHYSCHTCQGELLEDIEGRIDKAGEELSPS